MRDIGWLNELLLQNHHTTPQRIANRLLGYSLKTSQNV
jgi:hypothetical protein